MDISYRTVAGFDQLECEAPFTWYWAVEKEAALEISNVGNKNWICKILFTIGTPPTIQSRNVDILLNGIKVDSICATQFYEISIIMLAGERKTLGFFAKDNLVSIKGDDRNFAFQLFDFRIEVEEEFFLSSGLRKIQMVQIELLEKAIQICDKYNLKYYLIYGSLLGAIRHGGMIPWDDDIDIVMFREDYEKFLVIAERELEGGYYLQIPGRGEECFFGGYAKLRNNNTAALDNKHLFRQCNQGIFIDIFPLDNLSLNTKKRKKYIKKIKCLQRMMYTKKYGLLSINAMNMFYLIRSKIYSEKILWGKFQRVFGEINKENSPIVAILSRYINDKDLCFYMREDFGEGIRVPFENLVVQAPINYIKLLKEYIGETYMQFPSDEERKPHHRAWWSTQMSYNEIRDKLFIPKRSDKRSVIIYGIGKKIPKFIKQFKGQIECIIDEKTELQGKLYKNVLVFPFEWIKSYSHNIPIIICADDFLIAQNKLDREGYYNYKFYFDKFDSIMFGSINYDKVQ